MTTTEITAMVQSGQITEVSLTFGNPDICHIPETLLFDTASSFIAPLREHKGVYKHVIDWLDIMGTEVLIVVGHTDAVGSKQSNLRLAERRAQSALAVLNDEPEVWEQIMQTEGRIWGTDTFQAMLAEADQISPGQQMLREYMAKTKAGRQLRHDLFRRYFARLLGDPATPPKMRSANPPYLACGERYTLGRGEHRPSRRAEFFLVRGVIPTNCETYTQWLHPCQILPIEVPSFTSAYYVSGSGSDASGGGTIANPWRTIGHALREGGRLRQTNQQLVIGVLQGEYAEESITLSSNTSLEGMAEPLPKVTNRTNEPAHPVILIDGAQHISISKLTITGGTLSGIRINRANGVTVKQCTIAHNYAPFGGGIAVTNAENITIESNTIIDNRAGTIETAVTDLDVDIDINPSKIGDREWKEISCFEIALGDAHGGGVYLADSRSVTIRKNYIKRNVAILFGGGIAIRNRPGFDATILIEENNITSNQVAHGRFDVPGSLEILKPPEEQESIESIGDPLVDRITAETYDLAASELVDLLHGMGFENGLGGGIALQHVSSRTRIHKNNIGVVLNRDKSLPASNRARRGGGIACYTGAYPCLEENVIAANLASDDGGGIAIDQFDPFLPITYQFPFRTSLQRRNYIPRQPITIINCRIMDNRCIGDGGGLYATGNAHVEIRGNDSVIQGNVAGDNGGGIRVSYATRLHVSDATITRNVANARPRFYPKIATHPYGELSRTGGGRNCCTQFRYRA